MTSIIIDGYNCIGISHDDLAAEREGFILKLSAYRKAKGHDIVVVFDGWKSGGVKEEATVKGGVKVIYSRIGENADSVIKRIIGEGKREWIVITSDRDIAAYAWTNGCVPVSSEDFYSVLERAEEPFAGGHRPLYGNAPWHDRRKGNPRAPSKKEKALMRALKRL